MSNLPYIFFAIVVLAVMEGVAWFVFRFSVTSDSEATSVAVEEMPKKHSQEQTQSVSPPVSSVENEPKATMESEDFPVPSIEVVDGVTERTIHIGVRQWEWNPNVIRAKEDERVRLIIHNADVRHTLVIPELGVDIDIPEDGAIAVFLTAKKGVFDFLCGTYCGIGHAEMQGMLIVE